MKDVLDIFSYDPYDLWKTDIGIRVRRMFYENRAFGKAGAIFLATIDWLFPLAARAMTGSRKSLHPITVSHLILLGKMNISAVGCHFLTHYNPLGLLVELASWRGDNGAWGWGVGFPWMSKNGLYPTDTPFVTHTPYVMEALLALAQDDEERSVAMDMFHGTWGFLETLKIMHQTNESMAISYAPLSEPRIVINANAYGAFAYALHAIHGRYERQATAATRAKALARWIVSQQRYDGGWGYYADDLPGNFIDCFHSCFVLKNLLKTTQLLPETADLLLPVIDRGGRFVRERFLDQKEGLCRRFLVRDIKDPYIWDIYDQAEFLGYLIDIGHLEEAFTFRKRVVDRFCSSDIWWCRIDCLGRRWGKMFLRWGIVPFWYHSTRLDIALSQSMKDKLICAE
ncbi:MAG TPA: hypothetical protein PKD55_04920 [Bellilinea sp.]|nr:hypothetical protein [Bellilinea sp.]